MTSTLPRRTITFGVWDLLHTGHLKFLKECSEVSDELIVGIQSDESVFSQKGKYPAINEEQRKEMVLSLVHVTGVFLYNRLDYLDYAKSWYATDLALSENNRNEPRFDGVREYIASHGGKTYYFSYDHTVSSTKIKNSIVESNWGAIWDKVGEGDKDDYEIVGHNKDKTRDLAQYITATLDLRDYDSIIDFGCGTGVLLQALGCDYKIGIDISRAMLNRASKYPDLLLIQSDHIPVITPVDHIISWGVLHYLPNPQAVQYVILEMKALADNVLLMEIPDLEKRTLRLEHRKKLGKIIEPEPLYFKKEWFQEQGFRVWDTDLKISDNSEFSFTALYTKE